MSAIPGVRFDITGASGSQGLLTPKSGWFAYVFPRGGYASQDSSGTLITFDSSAIAGRFGVGDWIQVGEAATIRQVAAVGGNSLSVSGAAVTVTENQRIFIIGSTEPTISGGSVTYSTPATTIRQRDDDGADRYTNSMVTSNANGLVQFFSDPAVYDVIVQDSNRAIQGSIVDLPVGVAEGISTTYASVFGATVTVNAAFGITGWATFGQTVTMNAALGVTGWATFGATVTMNANAGVTGTFVVGATSTFTGKARFGNSVSIDGALGVTGVITGTVIRGTSDISARYFGISDASGITTTNVSLSYGWGSTASLSITENSKAQAGQLSIITGGATYSMNPSMTITWPDGAFFRRQHGVMTCVETAANPAVVVSVTPSGNNATAQAWIFGVTPTHGQVYTCNWILFGTS